MRVILAPSADADLTTIFDSLATLNRQAAVDFAEKLIFRFRMLEKNPLLGSRCEELQSDLRRTTVRKYVVYYQVLPSHLRIVRILHGYRDHGPLLESSPTDDE